MFEELLELYKTKAAEIEKERKEAQAMVTLVSAIEKMSSELNARQTDVDLLGRLIDQVDRLSKDVADLKSQLKAKQGRQSPAQEPGSSEGKALDGHAKSLIDIISERPGRYTTSELVDMLGLNKTTVINVMKRAVDLDPRVKLTQGKRRKLYLTYIPEEEGQRKMAESDSASGDGDRLKLELMAMT
jgi:methylphosphotriester-DNA--protein-cysteine methyltransferase